MMAPASPDSRTSTMLKTKIVPALLAFTWLTVAGSALGAGRDQDNLTTFKASFADKGMAKVERLSQSEDQRLCTQYAQKELPSALRARLEKRALAEVRYPTDGNFIGNWKEGEKIAQNGQGMQSSDDPNKPAGGNCYACHQLAKQEIAFGNIGPSLDQYGKLRGMSPEILKYTWAKIFNSHAFNACSNMPRFGAAGILSEAQIRDLMALLLDPQSPVNK
jgi:sulfur-oxidizing protein SoxX